MNTLLQKNTTLRKKIDFWSALPWVWLVCAYCITLGVLIVRGEGYIDSDMSGEMILADLLNQERDLLLSKNWGYSSEIRVFYLQLIYRITLLIFPHNWFAARMLGQAVWLLLLVLCMLLRRAHARPSRLRRVGRRRADLPLWHRSFLVLPVQRLLYSSHHSDAAQLRPGNSIYAKLRQKTFYPACASFFAGFGQLCQRS